MTDLVLPAALLAVSVVHATLSPSSQTRQFRSPTLYDSIEISDQVHRWTISSVSYNKKIRNDGEISFLRTIWNIHIDRGYGTERMKSHRTGIEIYIQCIPLVRGPNAVLPMLWPYAHLHAYTPTLPQQTELESTRRYRDADWFGYPPKQSVSSITWKASLSWHVYDDVDIAAMLLRE